MGSWRKILGVIGAVLSIIGGNRRRHEWPDSRHHYEDRGHKGDRQ